MTTIPSSSYNRKSDVNLLHWIYVASLKTTHFVLGICLSSKGCIWLECNHTTISIQNVYVTKFTLCESVWIGHSCPWYYLNHLNVWFYGNAKMNWGIYFHNVTQYAHGNYRPQRIPTTMPTSVVMDSTINIEYQFRLC